MTMSRKELEKNSKTKQKTLKNNDSSTSLENDQSKEVS